MVSSAEPDARSFESCEKATDRTQLVWPSRGHRSCHVAVSHSRMVPSDEPDARGFESCEKATDHLVALSRSSKLMAKMGTKYSKVVEMCLTCLDEGNVYFGDQQEFQDDDGVSVGARYIEKVLGAINGIYL